MRARLKRWLVFPYCRPREIRKYSVLANENDQNLVNALSFINDTKKEEEKPVKLVVEENEVEKKVKSQRRTLKLAIVVLTAAALLR